MDSDKKLITELQGEPIRAPHSVFGHAVYLSIHPGRLLLLPFRRWFNKHYVGKYKFERLVFSIDLVLIGAIMSLVATLVWLILFPYTQFRDNVVFIATVAPHEIVSGAPSTLVIDYQNKTKETLRNPTLSLAFPKHFLLQSVSVNSTNVDARNITLSDVPPGGTGTVHVKGVMFGDVGGIQSFGSVMTFTHGSKNISDQTSATYSFSPKRSTLSLSLSIPERTMANQPMSGVITYENTGTIDFPEVRIKPEWPNGFTLTDSNAEIRDNAFVVPKIRAGSKGEIHFDGKLGNVPSTLDFRFYPSFTFGPDEYSQETLAQSVPILPAQISLIESVEQNTFIPGTDTVVRVHYKHIGETPLKNVRIGIVSSNPFFKDPETFAPIIESLSPHDEGDVTLTIPIKSSVQTALLTAFQHLTIKSHVIATYLLDPKTSETITTTSDDITTPLSTPLHIESFARYSSPEGDQIGRGPLPPRVGQKTSYWIFWHIDGTTNTIKNATMTGILPTNVRLTGRETSSEDTGVVFNPETNQVSWNITEIPPTLDPESQVFSAAFEVFIIPTVDQAGKPAPLLQNTSFTGTDTTTGISLHVSSPTITTSLASDDMAKNKGLVK